MDLGNRAVDSPAGPHLSPVEDEFLNDGWQVFHVMSVFSVWTEIREGIANEQAKVLEGLGKKLRENIVAGSGIVPILPALRIRCVGKCVGR
jgi:hypothetical protein